MTITEQINLLVDFKQLSRPKTIDGEEQPVEFKAVVKPYEIVCEICGAVMNNTLTHLYKRDLKTDDWTIKCKGCKKTMTIKRAKKLKNKRLGINKKGDKVPL